VLEYYKSVGGDEVRAQRASSRPSPAACATKFGLRTSNDVVSGERDHIMKSVREKVDQDSSAIGVVIIDVG